MPPLSSLRSLRPTDIERLVDALDRAFGPDGRTGAPTPPAGPNGGADAPGSPRREDVYAEARRVFGAKEEELRANAAVTERVLQQLRGHLPTAPQQLLVLRAPVGGVAGGRVRIRNASGRAATFAFRPLGDLPMRLTPARLSIPPGESAVVDVRVDLLHHPGRAGDQLVLGADVLADGRPTLKLWVEIELDRPAEAP